VFNIESLVPLGDRYPRQVRSSVAKSYRYARYGQKTLQDPPCRCGGGDRCTEPDRRDGPCMLLTARTAVGGGAASCRLLPAALLRPPPSRCVSSRSSSSSSSSWRSMPLTFTRCCRRLDVDSRRTRSSARVNKSDRPKSVFELYIAFVRGRRSDLLKLTNRILITIMIGNTLASLRVPIIDHITRIYCGSQHGRVVSLAVLGLDGVYTNLRNVYYYMNMFRGADMVICRSNYWHLHADLFIAAVVVPY